MDGSPNIFDALQILFHLLFFVFMMSVMSLVLERIWVGRTRWLILPVIAISIVLFSIYPGLIVGILHALVGPSSLRNLAIITGFGALAGMAVTSL